MSRLAESEELFDLIVRIVRVTSGGGTFSVYYLYISCIKVIKHIFRDFCTILTSYIFSSIQDKNVQTSQKICLNTFMQEMYNESTENVPSPDVTRIMRTMRSNSSSLSANLDILHKVILRIRDNYICLICGSVSISLFQPANSATYFRLEVSPIQPQGVCNANCVSMCYKIRSMSNRAYFAIENLSYSGISL